MEDNTNSLVDKLLARVVEYCKTSIELLKLKTVDKASTAVSSLVFHSVVFALIASFMLFLNLGLAFWLGEVLGKIYYGFFVVGAFYGIIGVVLYLFMHKTFRKIICNYIIRQMLK